MTVNPTPAEASLISQLFAIGDTQGLGVITGDVAVKILSRANLPHTVLGEVWSIADKDNNGFLTKSGIAVAIRLIGYAQRGEAVSEALLATPGPLASIEGISGRPTSASPSPQSISSKSKTQLPPLTQQDKTKFLRLFISCGPVNGLLSGEKARDVFVKSKLPYDKLSQIWNLADTRARGALDATDFTLGMYFIQACMSSSSFSLPEMLPKWLYEQASQSLDHSSIVTHGTGTSSISLNSPFQTSFSSRQNIDSTGPGNTVFPSIFHPTSPIGHGISPSSHLSVFMDAPAVGMHGHDAVWEISSEARAASDNIFDGLDSQRRGFIEGDVAVPFMLKSNLPPGDLAQIWDLSDINNDGKLTREGFAVAICLIKARMAGFELPQNLPSSLVPERSTSFNLQSDLLLDDTFSSPQRAGVSATNDVSSPQNLSKHNGTLASIQGPFGSSAGLGFTSSINKDLLSSDDDDKVELPDNSAEVGNLRNQLASTTLSLQTAKSERAAAEESLSRQDTELSQLQTQLASAKASYETESQILINLRERLSLQRNEIQNIRQQLITAESELSAAKVEKGEVERAVLKDKEEVRELQQKMKHVSMDTEAIRGEVEKRKKDARQQKGLLAIAKKQLATAETEKTKAKSELDTYENELEHLERENAVVNTQIADLAGVVNLTPSTIAATIALPDTPHTGTPRSSSRHSTNPFERLVLSSSTVRTSGEHIDRALEDLSSSGVSAKAEDARHVTESGFEDLKANDTFPDLFQSPPSSPRDHKKEELFPTSLMEGQNLVNELSRSGDNTPLNAEILNPVEEIEIDSSDSSDSSEEFSVVDHKKGSDVLTKQSDSMESSAKDVHETPITAASGEDLEPMVDEPNFRKRSQSPSPNHPTNSDLFGPLSSGSARTLQEPLVGSTVSSPAIEPTLEPSPVRKVSSITDFDEAFRTPSNVKDSSSTFKFNSMFDDNFDFSSAIATNGVNGAPPINQTEDVKSLVQPDFPENGAGLPPVSFPLAVVATPESTDPTGPPTTAKSDVAINPIISFDDAFGFHGSSSLDAAVANPVDSSHTQPAFIPSTSSPQAKESDKLEIRPSSPGKLDSPIRRPISPPIRLASPPQSKSIVVSNSVKTSSPPRASSPQPRALSGNKSSASPEGKETHSKHKLSIRFPFGRKDKSKEKEEKKGLSQSQQNLPNHQNLLSPVSESTLPGTITPAVEDDAEPVKQLAAMGFSRTQAISALEAHGYDLQRALNSLLGAA